MLRPRVIPCLLWKNGGLYKTTRFGNPVYVGDPINAIKIFNEKEVDELVLWDIEATKQGREPNYNLITEVASECFMPLGYGGGITTLDQMQRILSLGVEKIMLQSSALADETLVPRAVQRFGSSTIVIVIDYKKNWLGKLRVTTHGATKTSNYSPEAYAQKVAAWGAGEIILQSVDRDGTMTGYDIPTIKKVVESVDIPVVCAGGAGSLEDIKKVFREAHPSGAAAGSMFVFQGKHRAVLINYPTDHLATIEI